MIFALRRRYHGARRFLRAAFGPKGDTRTITAEAIQMDASAHCQLACPSCPTASGETRPGLGAGHLRVDQFEELLERNPGLKEVELSNYGEMFLNPRLPELLRCAQEHKVVLHADNGVNLNHASDETLEALVKYGFRSMTCSIDGATAETYSKYRVKGDFERVLGHIRKINGYKRKYRSGFPMLGWQFIVFGHNEHEIDAARNMAAELGMSFYTKLSWDADFSPIQNRELVQIQTGKRDLSREEFYRATGTDYMRRICYGLWRVPVVNWDGRVLGCCRNFWGDFGGNVFNDGLGASLNSEKIQHAREMLRGRAPERPDLPCTTCEQYHIIKRDGTWLTNDEITRKEPWEGGIRVSIVPEASAQVTDVDILVEPVRGAQRVGFRVGASFSAIATVPAAGDYLIHAFPKTKDAALAPVRVPMRVAERPVAQEFHIVIA